jgi:hypothetical protein
LTFNEIQKNSSRPLHASFSYNVSWYTKKTLKL